MILLPCVAAHPDRTPVLDLTPRNVLHYLYRHIQVSHRPRADNVAEIAYGISLQVRVVGSGIVHQADQVPVAGCDVPFSELQRRQFAVAMELPVPVSPLPVHDCGRVAEVNTQDTIDGLECIELRLPHRVQSGLLLVQSPDRRRPLTHLIVQHVVHLARLARTLSLRHRFLGNDAVLVHQVDEHVPLARIFDRRRHKVLDDSVVYGAVGGLYHRFEHEVRALNLVPEHHIALAVFELPRVELPHRIHAEQVQPTEQPASAGRALLGRRPVVEHRRERMRRLRSDTVVERDLVNVALSDRVLHQPVTRVGVVVVSQIGDVIHRQGLSGVCRYSQRVSSNDEVAGLFDRGVLRGSGSRSRECVTVYRKLVVKPLYGPRPIFAFFRID